MFTRNYMKWWIVMVLSVVFVISFLLVPGDMMARLIERPYARIILVFSFIIAITSALVFGYRNGIGRPIRQDMLRKNTCFTYSHAFSYMGKWIVMVQCVDNHKQGDGDVRLCELSEKPSGRYLHARERNGNIFLVGFD